MYRRFKRSSGVVMPIFSFSSPYGIGTMGKEAYEFVDFLEKSGQHYWQVLPMGHTDGNNCPYQCYSIAAGNPLFIDLDNLVERGLVEREFLEQYEIFFKDTHKVGFSAEKVKYSAVSEFHYHVLRKAYSDASEEIKHQVEEFAQANTDWLKDYSLFMALMDKFNKPIWEWDSDIKMRDSDALVWYSKILKKEIGFYQFVQYLFFLQWDELKSYANGKGIKIIGDIPFYPSPNSCDVWANPAIFLVNKDLVLTCSAGVPPDYFSETGQLWGNPVYNWNVLKETGYRWWINRIQYTLRIVDVIRLDHFRAFQDYWVVPAGEKTAINGEWLPGPRMDFFETIKNCLGEVSFIAEDLGIIGDDVRELLRQTGYPGMAVIIFGLRAREDNIHLPHNCKRNSVLYTGTHDTETFCQAIEELEDEADRAFALEYIDANCSNEPMGLRVIRTVFMSPADLAMVMAADLLSLGKSGRINIPGTVGNFNWSWRISKGALNSELAEKLRLITITYKRA